MKRAAWQRRKAMLHLAEATLARYESVKARSRLHPPDFNAMMMRICASIVEERDHGKPPACCDEGPHTGPHLASGDAQVRELDAALKDVRTLVTGKATTLTADERRRVDELRSRRKRTPTVRRNMLGDRVVSDDEFVTAKGDPNRHDDGPTHADEDTGRMMVLDDNYDTEFGGEDGEP